MFETEDMLPRPPPKPSAPPLPNDGAVKPEVPEVSIIFGKPNTSAPISTTTTTQQAPSYAAWKKQVLPRVTYPPGVNDKANDSPAAIYPMRASAAATPQSQPLFQLQHSKEISNEVRPVAATLRHSLESAMTASATTTTTTTNCTQQSHEQRRSVDSLAKRSVGFLNEKPLTICVSTQTDFNTPAKFTANLELNAIMQTLEILQAEQRQTRQLLEEFMRQQQRQQAEQFKQNSPNGFCCDMATQCELLTDASARFEVQQQQQNLHFESETIHQALPNVKIYSPLTKELTRSVTPTAQSTQYRNDSPTTTRQMVQTATKFAMPESNGGNSHGALALLPKACTEKSVVMNELALKYLPHEKLNELMHEAFINNNENAPLREIDNLQKASAVDMSTASFLYLRKYRLLPSQQQNEGTPTRHFLNQQTSPAFNQQQRQQPQQLNADKAASPIFDLERLRGQPKFL